MSIDQEIYLATRMEQMISQINNSINQQFILNMVMAVDNEIVATILCGGYSVPYQLICKFRENVASFAYHKVDVLRETNLLGKIQTVQEVTRFFGY